jgi:hypothetical protein
MNERDVTRSQRAEEQHARRYRELANVRDRDALHDALVLDPTLWDKDAPLTVVAARWRSFDAARRRQRREEIAARTAPGADPDLSLDPLSIVLAREELDGVRDALMGLDPRDRFILWLTGAGYSDEEILAIWQGQDFQPSRPTELWLRKRRQRARAQLKAKLAE